MNHMSRSRRLLRLAPFCLVATVTAQDAVDAAHAPPQLVLFTSVGERVVRPAVAPFEQATGIDVQIRRVPRRTGPAAAGQALHLTLVEHARPVGAVAVAGEQPATDVGVERLDLHAEAMGCLATRDHGHALMIINVDLRRR